MYQPSIKRGKQLELREEIAKRSLCRENTIEECHSIEDQVSAVVEAVFGPILAKKNPVGFDEMLEVLRPLPTPFH